MYCKTLVAKFRSDHHHRYRKGLGTRWCCRPVPSPPPPLTLIQTCGINLMFIQCICSSTVYSPITLYQHTLSDKSFVFTFQSDSSLLLPTFSPHDVLFTSCSLSHYKDKILEQLATDPSVGQSYSTLSSVTLINTKPLLSSI